jgi:hypothetical protein|tara:strand:- start:95 stop:355 length:261 start_codon:yes stop_codon:yes gene_type:complete
MNKNMKYLVTMTDAIHDGMSWVANGSIVDRRILEVPCGTSERKLWMAVRERFGYTGCRGRFLDMNTWMPYNSCMMFHVIYSDGTEI